MQNDGANKAVETFLIATNQQAGTLSSIFPKSGREAG
jgi:hypothetical protein